MPASARRPRPASESLQASARRVPSPREAIARALERIEGQPVTIVSMCPVAGDRTEGEGKQIGYGEPALVTYRAGRDERRVVFRTMLPNWFGHDRRSDRVDLALLAWDTYRHVPDHVRALDVGVIDDTGTLVSLRGCGEPYLITTYAEGTLYARDLRRIEREGRSTEGDVSRARALASWIAALHRDVPGAGPEVYHRAVRDLVGSGEGIFGIADAYPSDGPIPAPRLASIEQRCVAWRWRLRSMGRPVRRTHGDFHPYNVLFREGVDFTVLDASRGCAGEPADDLAAMAINYVFGAVTAPEAWTNGILPVWDAFWSTYLDATGDRGVLSAIAPFFAWRALVVACPVWYPDLTAPQREGLLAFAEKLLDADAFDPRASLVV